MPAKAKPAKGFMIVEGVGGRVAVNPNAITRVSFATPNVPGLLDERKYLRLYFSGAYFDSVDVENRAEQARVLGLLGLEDLVKEEVTV